MNFCLSCRMFATLMGIAPNPCACNYGFYGDLDASNCMPCYMTATSCIGPNEDDALSCYPNAELAGTAPHRCVCRPGFSPSPDASNCVSLGCHDTCNTCANTTQSGCNTCKPNASLLGAPPNSCSCNSGYYYNWNTEECDRCHHECVACVGPLGGDCLGCYEYAELSGAAPNTCICSSGRIPTPDSTNCVDQNCNPNCWICAGTGLN
jgi:proprotein convertase subtilisin/kexin type 5